MKSDPANRPLAQPRVARAICACGNRRRNSRSAGIVMTASPAQLAPRTMMRFMLFGGALVIQQFSITTSSIFHQLTFRESDRLERALVPRRAGGQVCFLNVRLLGDDD